MRGGGLVKFSQSEMHSKFSIYKSYGKLALLKIKKTGQAHNLHPKISIKFYFFVCDAT